MPVHQSDIKVSAPVNYISSLSSGNYSPSKRSYGGTSSTSSSLSSYRSSYSSSNYQSSSLYSSKYRTSSLDRSPLTSTTRDSKYTSSSSSYASSSRPPRAPIYSSNSGSDTSSLSSTSSNSPSSSFSRKYDSGLEVRTRLPKFETSNTVSNSSNITSRSRTSPLKAIHPPRSTRDAIYDYQSPVLTRYRRDLTETNGYSGTSRMNGTDHNSKSDDIISRKSISPSRDTNNYTTTLNTGRSYGSLTSLSSDSNSSSTVIPRISTGSSGSLALDENSNQTSAAVRRRSRYDDDNNNNDEDSVSRDTTSGSNNTSPLSRLKASSPSSSSDDVSDSSYRRIRRSSGNTSSGYGSDNASSLSHSSSSSEAGASTTRTRYRDSSGDKSGLVGLRNLGNTCFMNSILQCLSNTKPLLDYMLKDGYVTNINTSTSSMNGSLIKAFANLMKTMWKGGSSSDSIVSPQEFKKQIEKFAPRFTGYSQQDAQELLRYVLTGLHEDVNRVTSKPTPITTDIDDAFSDSEKADEAWRRYMRYEDSKIQDIFVGQLKSTLKCTVCGHCSVTFDPFWDLSLPIPKDSGSIKLTQCLDLFTKEETLDGDEKPTCAKCMTRRKCTKSFSIYKFPQILVLHLKRFSPNERFRAKLSTCVDFPINRLNLSAYTSPSSGDQSCAYNLYAVSNHSGTTYSGHYTAYCKHPLTTDWHDFNDSRVTNASGNSIVSSEAYVLFYEQVPQCSRL